MVSYGSSLSLQKQLRFTILEPCVDSTPLGRSLTLAKLLKLMSGKPNELCLESTTSASCDYNCARVDTFQRFQFGLALQALCSECKLLEVKCDRFQFSAPNLDSLFLLGNVFLGCGCGSN